MSYRYLTFAIAFFAASTACAENMTGVELTNLLSKGKKIGLGGPGKGYVGTLVLTADGKGKGEAKLDNGKTISFSGKWKIEGNKFCRTWTGGSDSGKRVCETWKKDGPNSVTVLVKGKPVGTNHW